MSSLREYDRQQNDTELQNPQEKKQRQAPKICNVAIEYESTAFKNTEDTQDINAKTC
jgi:hypothetical protein